MAFFCFYFLCRSRLSNLNIYNTSILWVTQLFMCQFRQVYQAYATPSQSVNTSKMTFEKSLQSNKCQHENKLKSHKTDVAHHLTIIFSKRSITSFSDKFMQRSSTSAWESGTSLIEGWESIGCWMRGFSFFTPDFLKLVILSRCKDIHLKISRNRNIGKQPITWK